MKTRIIGLSSLLLACALSAFGQTSSTTTARGSGPSEGDVTARAELCQKGCMAHHDSSVVSCRMVKAANDVASCVRSADEKKAACDQECVRRHPAKAPSGSPRASDRRR